MIKLLDAGFTKLRKSKIFWLLMAVSVALAVFMTYTQYNDMKNYGDVIEVEQLMLNYATIIGIVISIFVSLFLGSEYSDGIIRNKVSIGHKRANIYLSNYIITAITSICAYIVFIIIIAIIGIPLFGMPTMQLSKLFMLIGCIFVTILSYSSICVFIEMLCSQKTVSAIINVMLVFGLMMGALICLNILNTPKFIQTASITDQTSGGYEMIQQPNPKYPSETKKKICQTLLDINPAGQCFEIAGRVAPNYGLLVLYSLGIVFLFNCMGLELFRRKELK